MSIKQLLKETTLKEDEWFHGTDDMEQLKYDLKNDGILFFSKDYRFSKDYGKYLLKVTIKNNNFFDSFDKNDIKKLYDDGFILEDPYFMYEDDVDNSIKDYVRFDDFGDGYYPTAEDFYNATNMMNNTWEAIENTRGVVEHLLGNYDGAIIYEDGIENLMTTGNNIKIIKQIK